MRGLGLLTVLIVVCGGCWAQAEGRYEDLNSLYSLYNQRFDSQGKYHPNDRKAEEFTAAQEKFAQVMKAQGALQEVLRVDNNFDSSLWVRLYVLQDEQGRIMTLYWEQGKYQDEEVRSFLRFRSLPSVSEGLKFIPVFETHAFTIKGFYLTPESGGVLQLIYSQNLRKMQMSALNLYLQKQAGMWGLLSEQQKRISRADIDVWTSLLPPNGGVGNIRCE